MATHSDIVAWKMPWAEEPGGLQSMELQRPGHYWSDLVHMHAYIESLIILSYAIVSFICSLGWVQLVSSLAVLTSGHCSQAVGRLDWTSPSFHLVSELLTLSILLVPDGDQTSYMVTQDSHENKTRSCQTFLTLRPKVSSASPLPHSNF